MGVYRMTTESKFFVTVDWCDTGKRGIFCSSTGEGFVKETEHTVEEMQEIVGSFFIILNPKSELFTKEELKKYNRWRPLAEYRNHYGISIKGGK